MEYYAHLADIVWELINDYISEEDLGYISSQLVIKFEQHGVEDWKGSVLHDFSSNYEYKDEDEFIKDEIEDDDDVFRATIKGKSTVKLLLQASNIANCSILDAIKCAEDNDCTNIDGFDAFLLEVFTNDEHPLMSYIYNHEPAVIPLIDEENEEPSFFIQMVVLCFCTFGSAFDEGGIMEGKDFKEFLAERP